MKFFKRFEAYHFEIQHILVLFIIVVVFQTALSFINSQSTNTLFQQAMDYYRRESAERVAELTTTALELQLEPRVGGATRTAEERAAAIQALDKLLSQQVLQRNIDEVFLLVNSGDTAVALREGEDIYNQFFSEDPAPLSDESDGARKALDYYSRHAAAMVSGEQILSSIEGDEIFHVLVPFYDHGEIVGGAYMRITPDIGGFVRLIETAYNQSGVLFTALILIGFLAMFFIYSYTARERDLVQQQLFDQRSKQLRQQVEHQKESLFTQRIYHTHHKAEKVMGFIKEDLRNLGTENLDETRARVIQYANFVSRVIYDMKSYDPPVQVIRNSLFRTDINRVIKFIVEHVFQRVYRKGVHNRVDIKLDLQPDLPEVQVNEYVIWEILEPLIQNAIDHNQDRQVTIQIQTRLLENENIRIEIEDNGRGFLPELLELDEEGVRALFRETVSTKELTQNSGYGCYLAWEISKRCGWKLDATTSPNGGALLSIMTNTG